MSCQEVQDLLHGYMDGELDLVRTLDIERHLQDCSVCARRSRPAGGIALGDSGQRTLFYPARASGTAHPCGGPRGRQR